MAELKRILLVDDEPDIRTVAKIALEQVGGLDVETCAGAQEFLDRVPAFAPDLALMDVMMPEMDGPSVLQALRARAHGADLPVMFFTAKTQKSDIEELLKTGAIGVLEKPFDPMLLADQVKTLWQAKYPNG